MCPTLVLYMWESDFYSFFFSTLAFFNMVTFRDLIGRSEPAELSQVCVQCLFSKLDRSIIYITGSLHCTVWLLLIKRLVI